MHELSIAEAIADKVQVRAAGRPVSAVAIRVGHFRQVVPDALQFSWMVVREVAGLNGCRLEIEQVPATIRCCGCAMVTTLDLPILSCAACGSSDVRLLSGQELVVVSLELLES
ncbi:MAG: hydrogenase maturation nickel metallochaperone HypA [Acidimicrobiales bacterium]